MSIASGTIPKPRNSFDLLRLGLAVVVVFNHAQDIGGFGLGWFDRAIKMQTITGYIAVLGFFGLSGFLVSQSFIRTGNWAVYVRHRALRLLPAFYTALILTAFVASPWIAHLQHIPWKAGDAEAFVFRNAGLKIRQWTVGPELKGLAFTGSINGALWSLFPEACCYLVLMVGGLCGWFSRRRYELVLLAALLFVVNAAANLPLTLPLTTLPSIVVLNHLSPYVLAFLVGATVQTYREMAGLGGEGAVLFGLLSAAALKFGGWQIFGPVLFPLFILHLGHAFECRLKADFSYGLYVYHFPILQIMAAGGLPRWGLLPYFLVGLTVALACGAASWFGIEKPALRYK
jgi:peptidoglycan/LPS O-acetylase OafA/YrhL